MAIQNPNWSYKICPDRAAADLRGINEQNRQFWSEQSKLMKQRMSNDAVVEIAVDDVRSETERRLPIAWHKSFEQALAEAAISYRLAQKVFSRSGGRTSKRDSLQRLISKIVGKSSKITAIKLLSALPKREGEGTIISIDRNSARLSGEGRMIRYFDDSPQKEKTAPLSGLKDRLSRAKKYSR